MQSLTVAEFDQEVKFDQEASITDVKNTLMGELRSAGGSSNVSEESPMSASTENAMTEKSVREMQSASSMGTSRKMVLLTLAFRTVCMLTSTPLQICPRSCQLSAQH